MSGRDDASSLRLPLHMLFVLFLCICGLAVHFVAEGLAPADNHSLFELAAGGEITDSVHEHGEDHFVFSFLNSLRGNSSLTLLISQEQASSLSRTVSPLLPPPN